MNENYHLPGVRVNGSEQRFLQHKRGGEVKGAPEQKPALKGDHNSLFNAGFEKTLKLFEHNLDNLKENAKTE